MAIPRKPTEKKPVTNEMDIDALIEKGGSIAAPQRAEKGDDAINLLQLRLRGRMLRQIDENIKRRYPYKETRPPRHAWFIEAFLEKLEREKNS